MAYAPIKFEYWIDVDGDTHFADGDAGDYNHEGYAQSHLMPQVVDSLNDFFEDGFSPKESEACDAHMVEHLCQVSHEEEYARWYESNYEAVEMLSACKRSEASAYVMLHLRWARLAKHDVQVAFAEPDDLRRIAEGVKNALFEEDCDYADEDYDVILSGFAAESWRTYDCALSDLSEGRLCAQLDPVPQDAAATKIALHELDKLDRAAMPLCYQHTGD